MFLASFFDPGNDGFTIVDLAQLIGLFLLTWGAVWGALAWNTKRAAANRQAEREEMERRILDALVEHTKPIQPGYRNGGESLADVAGFNRILMDRQVDVIRDVRGIRERLDDHIDNHHGKE